MSCYSKLVVMGERNLLDFFIEKVKGSPVLYPLSEKEIEIYSQSGDLEAMQAPQPEQALCCNSIVPVPPEVIAKGYNGGGYEFQIRHWGVTWELRNVTFERLNDSTAQYRFWSKLTPPVEALNAAAEKYPNLNFELTAVAIGDAKYLTSWKNGRIAKDEYADISQQDLDDFKIDAEDIVHTMQAAEASDNQFIYLEWLNHIVEAHRIRNWEQEPTAEMQVEEERLNGLWPRLDEWQRLWLWDLSEHLSSLPRNKEHAPPVLRREDCPDRPPLATK